MEYQCVPNLSLFQTVVYYFKQCLAVTIVSIVAVAFYVLTIKWFTRK